MKPAQTTYLIAEMACSHEGSPELARRIIDSAAFSGADAIQLQIWRREIMVSPDHSDFEKLARIELSAREWSDIVNYVRSHYPELDVLACVYDEGAVDFGEEIKIDGYKLHSADLANPKLIRRTARTGKPVNLCTGASTLDEIHAAVRWFQEFEGAGRLTLMCGYQAFPTRPDDVHLRFLARVKHLFGLEVGYQDHCAGDSDEAFWLPAAAIGLGVGVIEKHITHDRSVRGIDFESALDPGPFHAFVRMVRAIDRAMGSPHPRPFSDDEKRYRVYAKKSLVPNRALAAGHVLQEDDLMPLRTPKSGISPALQNECVGRVLAREIPAFAAIQSGDLI